MNIKTDRHGMRLLRIVVPTKNYIRRVNRWKFEVLAVNRAGHESCFIVVSFCPLVLLPDSSKYAPGDSCPASSACGAAATDYQAAKTEHHVQQLVAIAFLVVPTVSFRLLFVFVVLGHQRCHAIHFNVTAHPRAEWTGGQIAEAFLWDSAPRYLLHDRDCIYRAAFRQRVGEMGIREVLVAPRSPWQNPYAERFIGSLRRECLDHIIVFNESSLRHILKAYFEYYEHSRTHLALEKDTPEARAIQPREAGIVVELPPVGGLHHRYERRAA